MTITKRYDGEIRSIVFEPTDTLADIASVSRCTSDELASLMEVIWCGDWHGQPIDWSDEE